VCIAGYCIEPPAFGTLLFAMYPLFRFFSDAQSSVRKASATCLLLAWLMVEMGRWRWWRDLAYGGSGALEMVARFGDEDVVGRGGRLGGGN